MLLTALMTALALLPVAIQLHQPGHEIEGPMAVVILGGLVSSTIVSLLLVPPLAARWLQPEAPALLTPWGPLSATSPRTPCRSHWVRPLWSFHRGCHRCPG